MSVSATTATPVSAWLVNTFAPVRTDVNATLAARRNWTLTRSDAHGTVTVPVVIEAKDDVLDLIQADLGTDFEVIVTTTDTVRVEATRRDGSVVLFELR